MTEKKFGIIGTPLSHSLSPKLHNFWLGTNNLKANYSLLEIGKNEIKNIIDKIRTKELHGINVTIPYKQEVIPHVDLIINDARQTSSINTIYLNSENKIVGENTDVYGFEESFLSKLNQQDLAEKNFLILGAGGVTPSLVYALLKNKIKRVFVSNRSLQKVENLKKMFPVIEIISWEKVTQRTEEMDIIINATSLGMKNGPDFEFLIKKFKSELVYYDVVYNPLETKMMKNLKENKIKTFNGLEMFLFQAQKSFYIWNNITPNVNEEIKREMILNLK